MFCRNCGTQLADGAEFCHKCGTKIAYSDSKTNTPDCDPRSRVATAIAIGKLVVSIGGGILMILFISGIWDDVWYMNETDLLNLFIPGIEIRESYLTEYSDTITIGDAFDRFFSDGKWSHYREDDNSYVVFKGNCMYLGEKSDVRVTFQITGDSFRVYSVDIDGVNLGYIMMWAFLSAVYESA